MRESARNWDESSLKMSFHFGIQNTHTNTHPKAVQWVAAVMNRCCNGIYFVNPFVAVERRKKSQKRWTTKPNKSMHNKSEEWTRENFDIIKNGSALFIVPIFLRLLEIMHQTIWTVNDERRGLCHDIGCTCAIMLSCYRAIHDVWCMVKGNDECDIQRWVRVNGEMNWIRNTRNVRNHPEWCNIITSHHIFICGNGPIRMELLEKRQMRLHFHLASLIRFCRYSKMK